LQIEQAAAWVRESRRILFITGAGVSADSGLPTYRGIGGLYHDKSTDEGLPIEVALSGAMFCRSPDVTWKYIHQIEAACRGAAHNRSHEIIAELERRSEVVVLTQNVDGFHRTAGSTRVIDIHGDLHELHCTKCPAARHVADYEGLDSVPTCEECGGLVRPNVVLFGEQLPSDKLEEYQHQLSRGFDVVFVVGTTAVFPYIAAPVVQARQQGVPTVEINPGESEVSDLVQVRLRRRAKDALEAIWEAL
jgi:NAD-dependent deacetylase